MHRYARLCRLWTSWYRALPSYRRTARADAQRAAPAEITIGVAVIAPDPERFGVNLDIPGYEPWQANAVLLNNWVAGGGMEPIVLRYKGTATGGSATTIEVAAGQDPSDPPATPDPPEFGRGFFDDACVRIYRIAGGQVRLLRTATVAHDRAHPDLGARITLAEEGPPVRAGDVFFLSLVRDDAPHIDPGLGIGAAADTWHVFPEGGDPPIVAARRDRTAVAPAHGSRTSLRLRLDAPIEGGVFQFVASTPGQQRFNAFEPGRRYRIELWLKQEGVAGGRVTVSLAPYPRRVRRTFRVTGEWARYRCSFTATRRAGGDTLARLTIACTGPGTLWVDDVRLYDTRWPAHAVRPEVRHALAAYRPGSLRIWGGQTNLAWGTALDSWLAPEGQAMRVWMPGRGPAAGPALALPTALALARACGATPWLIVHLSFDEGEWRNLIEYLAGPPQSPYGALRVVAGQHRPWTEEFARIRVECGNETWNPFFRPWNFESGTQYGQFAEYFFSQARASPSYPAAAAVLDFVLGGRKLSPPPRTYGMSAREASPSSSLVCFSEYLPAWGASRIPARTREEEFRNTLIYAPWAMHYLMDRQVALHHLHAKMGFPSTLAMSEIGAHYPLPRPNRPVDRGAEVVGNSLATAVGLLDAFLYNAALGVGPQAYYTLGIGPRWASHSEWQRGGRPYPSWLALLLRNRYAEGPMIAATVSGGQSIDLPEITTALFPNAAMPAILWASIYTVPARSGIRLLATYAFRRGGRYAIFVLSRQLSLPTPVTLHLPATPTATRLYTLTGDPRATNLEAMRIRIRRRAVRRFTKDYAFTMPPGSIYLFVVDTA